MVATGLLAGMLALGCDTTRDPGELFAPETDPVIVVDATLIVDRAFPEIRISRTQAPDRPFTSGGSAVTGATVTVESETGPVIEYRELSSPGRYHAIFDPAERVQPGTIYRLLVVAASGERVAAVTRTPDRYTADGWLLLDNSGTTIVDSLVPFEAPGDTLPYTANRLVYTQGLLEARFQRGDVPAYQIGLFSLDLDSDFVIDPDFFEEEDFDDLDRFTSSPALEALDGAVRLPWFAIYFEGRYKVKIYAIDENWFDLVRSSPDLGGSPGFGGNAGDNFEAPIFHVEGGIGLFGSAAVDSVGFYIEPLP